MTKNRIIYSLAALLIASACTQAGEGVAPDAQFEHKAPIIGNAEGATRGQILVKFDAATGDNLAATATRSGIAKIDMELDAVKANSITRVFPEDVRRETVTRQSGLHLWYVVDFDQAQNLNEVAAALSSTEGIAKVEYMQMMSYAERTPAIAYSAQPIAAVVDAPVNDNLYGDQWALKNRGREDDDKQYGSYIAGADINAEQAWEIYATKKGASDEQIIVAILDEGVAYDHPELKSHMWVNAEEDYHGDVDADNNGYKNDVHGYNFVQNSGRVTYGLAGDTGHSTHIAGIIAAKNNNSEGIASIAGGSDNVKIMSCQIFDRNYSTTTLQQAMAVKYAADNGAVVLQCSWGLNSSEAPMMNQPSNIRNDEDYVNAFGLLKEALDYFIHNASSPNGIIDGGVVVFSAGNESAPLPGYPSNYNDYICVTSIAADYTPAIYTNFGGNSTVAAPGGDRDYYVQEQGEILSTLPYTIASSGYGYMEGTSMATPMVSGVIALGLSHAANNYKHIKAESIKELVKKSTNSIEEYFSGEKLFYFNSVATGEDLSQQPDYMNLDKFKGKMGTGLIDAAKFLRAIEGADFGADMKIPNYTVGIGATRSQDLAPLFADKSLSFSVSVADSSVAEVTIEGTTLTIKGITRGTTKATIKAGAESQTIVITVKNTSNNGWL